MRICQATTAEQIEQTRSLFQEYAKELAVDLCFQGFVAELAGLPGGYAPPGGRLLLAIVGEQTAGCVALRPLSPGVCEMKRLYLRPAFRGQGLGKKLAEHIVAEARSAGYQSMKLDTLPRLQAATSLYESLGFTRCAPYNETPLGETIFMELRL